MQSLVQVCFVAIVTFDALCRAGDVSTPNRRAESLEMRDARIPQLRPGFTVQIRNCMYRPGYRKLNRRAEIKCCQFWEKRFYSRWYVGSEYLTKFLDIMKTWKCPQMKKQCKKRFFDFSPFTNIVYMRACTNQLYQRHCFNAVKNAALIHSGGRFNISSTASNMTSETWDFMVEHLRSENMSYEELSDPCVQVALYESARGGYGRYHETIKTVIPFCGFSWCGYDIDTVERDHVSVWKCMPARCRIGISIVAAVMICLGIAILFTNVLVIAVYWYRKRMNNSQIVYKVTLAIGDTLVGAIVLPTFVSTMYLMYTTKSGMDDPGAVIDETTRGILPTRLPRDIKGPSLSRWYMSFVGFFTIASFLISVYTLMLASFDRMVAICFPMSFIRSTALRAAKWCCLVLVILVLFMATLPMYVSSIAYSIVASVIISIGTKDAVVLYCVIFLLPLVLVWLSNITLVYYTKKYTSIRRSIASISNSQIASDERKLAKTLSVMVGAFSSTLIPVIVVLLVSLFVSNIHLDDPEHLNETATMVFNSTEVVAVVILATNSLWNYFIYGSRDKDFKQHSKAIERAVADRLGLLYLWRRIKMSSQRRATITSLSSAFTNLSSTKSGGGSRNSRPSKASISADLPLPDNKNPQVAVISVRKLDGLETAGE